VIVEVLSRETRRTDEGEKKDAYLTIPSLMTYLLVEQGSPTLTVFRREEQGFVGQTYAGNDALIPLDEIGAELSLTDIYAEVEFPPETAGSS
jgi:Uma2 family endonuclease